MEIIATAYLQRAEAWVFITTLVYFLINGAGIFETLVLVPKWASAPPASFNLLADKNGMSLKTFWIVAHSLHEITFIAAIAFSWKIAELRNWLLILFAVHFAIRVWTLAYFAPNIIRFEKLYETNGAEPNITAQAKCWQQLNYLRMALFIAVSFGVAGVYCTMCNALVPISTNVAWQLSFSFWHASCF